MKEIKITFKNYALVKDQEYNLTESTVLFMRGPNERGKTTFLHGLETLMTITDDKVNPVRNGQEDGYIIGTLPGVDGQIYTVRYDFDNKGNKKFRFIRPDGTKVSSIKEMRSMFNYTPFTASDWLSLSLTEKGRQEQRAIFTKLLSEEEREKLAEIDLQVSPSGSKFTERTALNKKIDIKKAIVDTHVLTDEENKILSNGTEGRKLLDEINVRYDEVSRILEESSSALTDLTVSRNNYKNLKENHSKSKANLEKDIERLKAELKEKEDALIKENDEFDKLSKTYDSDIANLEKKVDEKYIKQLSDEFNGYQKENPDKTITFVYGLKARKERGEAFIKSYDAIIEKKESWKKDQEELDKLREEEKKLTKDIETLRDDRKNIIKNSKNIPAGWSMDEDYVYFEGIPYKETDISTSRSIRGIAELMIHINKAPIMIMGDAEGLGYPVLEQLNELAKENNRIMIFAEHDRNADDVELVCYDEIKPSDDNSNTKKDSGKSSLF